MSRYVQPLSAMYEVLARKIFYNYKFYSKNNLFFQLNVLLMMDVHLTKSA